MQCLKCGNETAPEQIFCEECLASMAEYPVKSNTPVLLPVHTTSPVIKISGVKRTVPMDIQLRRLKGWNRVLVILTLMALLTTFVLGYILRSMQEEANETLQPGQNYSAIQPETSAPILPSEWMPVEAD